MGREVRMVPPDWEHPKDERDRYIPMLDASYEDAVRQWEDEDLPEWIEGQRLWEEGKVKRYGGHIQSVPEMLAEYRASAPSYRPVPENPDYLWWAGEKPSKPRPEDYMPDWPDDQRTHFMMYENTSEGTPISPAFATADELARWLADTGASAFAGCTATYEEWLSTIQRGSAVSAVMQGGEFKSGVSGMHKDDT